MHARRRGARYRHLQLKVAFRLEIGAKGGLLGLKSLKAVGCLREKKLLRLEFLM